MDVLEKKKEEGRDESCRRRNYRGEQREPFRPSLVNLDFYKFIKKEEEEVSPFYQSSWELFTR